VSDLALESREFDIVLGKLEPDGCRTPGLIDMFDGVQVLIVSPSSAESVEVLLWISTTIFFSG